MIGLDSVIDNLNDAFTRRLFPNVPTERKVYNGRVFPIKKDDVLKPCIFTSGKDYKDVLFNDSQYLNVFYDVQDEETEISIYDSSVDIEVGVVIVANLAMLYPDAINRPVEELLSDFKQVFLIVPSTWEVKLFIRGFKALGQYDNDELKRSLNMQPLHILRINTKVKYLLNNC